MSNSEMNLIKTLLIDKFGNKEKIEQLNEMDIYILIRLIVRGFTLPEALQKI